MRLIRTAGLPQNTEEFTALIGMLARQCRAVSKSIYNGESVGFCITRQSMRDLAGIDDPIEGLRFIYKGAPASEMQCVYDGRTDNWLVMTYDHGLGGNGGFEEIDIAKAA